MLLLDEPTAALDPRTKWVLVNLIRRLGEAGKTIITATHELEIVPIIADAGGGASARSGASWPTARPRRSWPITTC